MVLFKKRIYNYDKIITKKSIDLNRKIDEFIEWYKEEYIKGNYTEIGEYHFPIELRNLIEKVAVWYEIRYPSYEVNRLYHCMGEEFTKIDEEIFEKNQYINDNFDKNSDVRLLEWDKLLNTHAFINSLPFEEKNMFFKPQYIDILYLRSNISSVHFHLTKKGFVKEAENIGLYTNNVIKDEELKGLHLKDVLRLFKEKNELLPDNNIEKEIKKYERSSILKERFLNSILYRIIERGGNRIGPRRAFMFAKEFNLNIDIPMMYSIDMSDPGLRLFMNEYIKSGGKKDLNCYIDYFNKINDSDIINTISIQELILTLNNNAATFYTPEEDNLHQRLVNILSSKIDYNEVNKEKVKQLRIERKLKKNI